MFRLFLNSIDNEDYREQIIRPKLKFMCMHFYDAFMSRTQIKSFYLQRLLGLAYICNDALRIKIIKKYILI